MFNVYLRVQTHIPKCGHLIHSPCFTEMMKKGIKSKYCTYTSSNKKAIFNL